MHSRENTLETVRIESSRRPDGAVILMHGLGADGHDLASLIPELHMPESSAIRWILPHAPVRPVTINGGEPMRAWYDVTSIDLREEEDEAGIRESANDIGRLIRAERDRGIAARRIVLAGFSQGGAMALFTALRWPERLAGAIALSCYLPLPDTTRAEASPTNASIPVFMGHGTGDPIVPLDAGEASREILHTNGNVVTWRTYPMQHGLCAEEIVDLREWLLSALGATE